MYSCWQPHKSVTFALPCSQLFLTFWVNSNVVYLVLPILNINYYPSESPFIFTRKTFKFMLLSKKGPKMVGFNTCWCWSLWSSLWFGYYFLFKSSLEHCNENYIRRIKIKFDMQFLSFQVGICYGKENNLNRIFRFGQKTLLEVSHCDKNTPHQPSSPTQKNGSFSSKRNVV